MLKAERRRVMDAAYNGRRIGTKALVGLVVICRSTSPEVLVQVLILLVVARPMESGNCCLSDYHRVESRVRIRTQHIRYGHLGDGILHVKRPTKVRDLLGFHAIGGSDSDGYRLEEIMA